MKTKKIEQYGQLLYLAHSTLAISLLAILSMPLHAAQITCPASGSLSGENDVECEIVSEVTLGINESLANSNTIVNNRGGKIINAGNLNNTQSASHILNSNNSFAGNTITNLSTGHITNYGWITNENKASLPLSLASIINFGTIENHHQIDNRVNALLSNAGIINSNFRFDNEGTFSNQAGAYTTNNNALTNLLKGTVNNSGRLINQSSGIFSNKGTLTNQSGGSIENSGQLTSDGVMNNELGGILSNSGTFTFTLFGSSGQFNNLTDGKASIQTRLTNNSGGQIDNSGEINIGTETNPSSNGVLSNNGLLNNLIGGRINNNGQIDNNAHAEINNAGEMIMADGGNRKFNSSGKLTNQHGAQFITGIQGTVNNLVGGQILNAGLFVNKFLIINEGTFVNQAEATLTNDNFRNMSTGDYVNAGTMTSKSGIANVGRFEVANTGAVLAADLSSISRYTQSAGSTVVNGLIKLGNIDIQSGTLSGAGTLQAINNPLKIGVAAIVNPGDSQGVLNMLGDVDFSGKLIVEIHSLASFDVLNVEKLTLLEGSNVEFVFGPEFSATEGASLTFLDANSVYGTQFLSFSALGLPSGFNWNIDTNIAKGNLSIIFHTAAVPLPGGLPLFLSSAAFLFARKKGRISTYLHLV